MSNDASTLTQLIPHRRNRYYYGKLMDVLHFSTEQRYVLATDWLYNRTVLGPGVICGLEVESTSGPAGTGVVVHAGFAIDGWGREIIVPEDITLLPLTLTDPCGQGPPTSVQRAPITPPPPAAPTAPSSSSTSAPAPSAPAAPAAGTLPAEVMIQICYNECLTDYSPAVASDGCGCGDCEAGTVVESYCLRVVSGSAPAVTNPCLPEVQTALQGGKLHDALCLLSQQCAAVPADPCLTLANVGVAADGTLTVDSCSPRVVAPTNAILAQLIACLADCCAGTTPTAPALQISGVALSSAKSPKTSPATVVATLDPPASQWHVALNPDDSPPNALDITFTGATLDFSTVTLGTPQSPVGTFRVAGTGTLAGAALIQLAADTVRLFVKEGMRGLYKLELVGTPDAQSGGQAIMSQATQSSPATALDGEILSPPKWPTGEGVPGGNFGPIELNIT